MTSFRGELGPGQPGLTVSCVRAHPSSVLLLGWSIGNDRFDDAVGRVGDALTRKIEIV